jgi:Plavaka transposase
LPYILIHILQKAVEEATNKKDVTIIPIIISSDKTQLTLFRNKAAYPVYITIGNIPKHIRRKPSRQAQVLLGYLPTAKLEHITNKAARRRCIANLFHACMSAIVQPLEQAGVDGVLITDGAGVVRRGHPILAAYVGDYPEQVLVTCIKSMECPNCPTTRNELGEPGVKALRDFGAILDALDSLNDGSAEFRKNCKACGIKPVQRPFWTNLPFVHIFRSITPDVLHQLYQGVIKHVINWLKQACQPNELDARCRRLPPNHNIRLFLKGISHLSRVSGAEHDQITRFLLGIIIDIKLADNLSNIRLIKAVRGILDFLYLAKYPVHTARTLDQLEASLRAFHSNKDIFVQLGIRSNFNLPKLHFLGHYRQLFELFGTADNFNTEYTERLHIEMAKDAYRATNRKDEYPQMTAWLDRKERILLHSKFVQRRLACHPAALSSHHPLVLVQPRLLKMAKYPSASVTFNTLEAEYGAKDFEFTLAKFIIRYNDPSLSTREASRQASSFHIPFQKVPVYHRVKFVSTDPYAADSMAENVVDSIHVEPARRESTRGLIVPGRFDTALIRVHDEYLGDLTSINSEWATSMRSNPELNILI